MLSEADYQEAVRRYKNMKRNGHERQRYHALILIFQGYSQREVAAILLVDEETVGRWVRQYQERGLGGLRNHEQWGGEHGQREVTAEQVTALQQVLETEAMAGTQVGSGWTTKAVRHLIEEHFGVTYSKSGVRKLFAHLGWSYQCGRKLYIRRDPLDQARYEEETRALHHFLRQACHVANLARAQQRSVRPVFLAWLSARYDRILAQGFAFHESQPPLDASGGKRQGRLRRRTGHNLLLRLRDHKDAVLRFLHDPAVPFTNNQAERDLRMMKVRQKISGGFRSATGAQTFATLRTVLSTARKQGWNILATLTTPPATLTQNLRAA